MAGFWKKVFHLRNKTAAELQADKYFREIGGSSPFDLARYLGVTFSYDDIGDWVGVYGPDPLTPGRQHIYINENSNQELQERVLDELLMHHIEHEGVERTFNEAELQTATKWRRRRRNGFWWL